MDGWAAYVAGAGYYVHQLLLQLSAMFKLLTARVLHQKSSGLDALIDPQVDISDEVTQLRAIWQLSLFIQLRPQL